MVFVERPNLPQAKVTLAAVSGRYPHIVSALEKLGVKCLSITPSLLLDFPVNDHADMLLHPLGQRHILVADVNTEYAAELEQLGFEVHPIKSALRQEYPKDVALNAARIGSGLLCGRYPAPEILRYCDEHGIEVHFVRQGYAKCATCIVSEGAVITADRSIAGVCEACGIDVLFIREGHIGLEGYPYGFIGGSCGLIDKKLLAFTGNISTHPDGEQIARFLQKHGVKYICLTEEFLLDVGGILPLACV